MGRQRREKSANFWPPTAQVPNRWAPTVEAPHPSASHFFWVGASSGLHPSPRTSCENPPPTHTKKNKRATRFLMFFLSCLSIFILSQCCFFCPVCHFFMSRLHFYFVPTAVCFFLLCRLRFFFCPGAFFLSWDLPVLSLRLNPTFCRHVLNAPCFRMSSPWTHPGGHKGEGAGGTGSLAF